MLDWMRRLSVALLLGCLSGWLSPVMAEEFLDPDRAFKLAARGQKPLMVQFEIAPGYYLYREQFKVETADGRALPLQLPDGKRKFDETFQKEVEVYRDAVGVTVADTGGQRSLKVTAQGCADKGLCYPPITVQLNAGADGGWTQQATEPDAPVFGSAAWRGDEPAPAEKPATDGEGGLAGLLGGGHFWAVLLGFFVAGLGLSLTPCVLPMLPILSSIIVGSGASTRRRRLFLALTYSAGMVIVYTAIGVAAGKAGQGLAAYLQAPAVLLSFASVLVLFSLSMFGLYELQLPARWQQGLTERSQKLAGGQAWPVFVMGALSALIVGPCVTAPLVGALVYISKTGDAWLGGSALFALGCGMSVPLLLLGFIPHPGAWMERVKHVFGFALLAVALWLAKPALPWVLSQALWGAWGVGVALMVWPGAMTQPSQWLRGVLALALAFGGLAQWWGAAQGGNDPLRPLAPAASPAAEAHAALQFERVRSLAELRQRLQQTGGRPVMLDFYADWCVACKEMERFTFTEARVQARLKGALLLQVDVTANSADDRALLKEFKLFGPPATLFFDSNGQELQGLRVMGFQSADQFLKVIEAAGL